MLGLVVVVGGNVTTRYKLIEAERAYTHTTCEPLKRRRSRTTLSRFFSFLDVDKDKKLRPAVDAKVAFEKSDKNGDGILSEKELARSTGKVFTGMCLEAASLDRDCFEKGTDPKEKPFKSLW